MSQAEEKSSGQTPQKPTAEPLEEREVATFLEHNPRFFERYPDVLEVLNISHSSGSATSLIERQVAALRDTNRALQKRYDQLVNTARDNEQRVVQINRVAQVFIGMTTIETFVSDFSEVARHELGVDSVFVGLDNETAALPENIHRLPPESEISRALTNVFRRGKPILGPLDHAQVNALFGHSCDDKTRPQSAAMIPLGKRAPSGALVLASVDPDHFTPKMGTLFLEMTGQLATTALRRLLGEHGPA